MSNDQFSDARDVEWDERLVRSFHTPSNRQSNRRRASFACRMPRCKIMIRGCDISAMSPNIMLRCCKFNWDFVTKQKYLRKEKLFFSLTRRHSLMNRIFFTRIFHQFLLPSLHCLYTMVNEQISGAA